MSDDIRTRVRAEFGPLIADLRMMLDECVLPELWRRRIGHQIKSGSELLHELDMEFLDSLRDGPRRGFVARNKAKKARKS